VKTLTIIAAILLACGTVHAQDAGGAKPRAIWIGLENGTDAEAIMASELRALLRTYDLEPWILTRRLLIDEDQIPHSHPVLTIHTRHLGDELGLLSTFVHEQLHWLEEQPWLDDFRAAMKEFESLFPGVPPSSEGGARDAESTYRHLLVCDMEYQAMTTLVGEVKARETLSKMTHYEWIYEKVLNDPRVRQVSLRHGFDVSTGVPTRNAEAALAPPQRRQGYEQSGQEERSGSQASQ
jgi:hypothetical protein